MKSYLVRILDILVILGILYSVITACKDIKTQQEEIVYLKGEVKELQNQYYNLYNSHNYVLKQVEDMKQF